MGDRALVIFKHNNGRVSPVVYLHWAGEAVPSLLVTHKERMKGREGDVDYAAARFVGIAHEQSSGNTGLGIWNTPDEIKGAVVANDSHALEHYSHGDAGVIVVDAATFEWQAYGGYLAKQGEAAA